MVIERGRRRENSQPTFCSTLYPECIANLKLPIDAFYRESRSGVNIAKHNITTGLFELQEFEAERKNWPSTRSA
jgi:hypothetical protein